MPAESGPSSSSTETGKSPVISTPDLKSTADRGISKTESGLFVVKEDPTNVDPKDSALSAARGVGMSEKGLGSIKYPDKLSAEEQKEKQIEEGPTDWIDWNDRRVKGGGSGNNNGGGNIPSGEGGNNSNGGRTSGGEVVIDDGGIDNGGPTPGGEGGGDNSNGGGNTPGGEGGGDNGDGGTPGGEIVIDDGGIDGDGGTPGGEGGGNTPGGEGGGPEDPEGPPVYGPGVGDAYDPAGGDPTPPVPPAPPEDTDPATPEGREPAPVYPDFEQTRAELEDAIQRLAKAKDRSDSIFSRFHKKVEGRNDQAELDAASQHLKDVFAKYVSAIAGVTYEGNARARAKMAELGSTVLKDPNDPSLGYADGVSPDLIRQYEAAQNAKLAAERDATEMIVQEMASARYKVDQAQLEIKKQKPGGKFISKFRELWTKHPVIKSAIGWGLMGAGAVATASGAAPLAIGFFAARKALGTVGTYMGVEGAGRALTGLKSKREEAKGAREGLEGLDIPVLRDIAEQRASQFGTEDKLTGETFSDEQRVAIEQFVQQHASEIFFEPNSLFEAVRRPEINPSAVVDSLLDDRLDRLKRDSRWTRRSKYLAAAGAAVVGAASIAAIKDALDARPPVPRPAGEPTSKQLDNAFFQGIADHHGPSTRADWAALQQAGPGKAKLLWEANPSHEMVGKAFADGAWRDQLVGLSAKDQLTAARLFGQQFDAGTFSEQSAATIVDALK